VRQSLIAGVVLLVLGLLLLYLLRHLLVQVIVVALGIIGLVIAFVFVLVGLALILGRFWIGRVMGRRLAFETPNR
jgi:hypothetical protein